MAQQAAVSAVYGMPTPQFVTINWEYEGKVETLRFGGYAHTVQDPISAMVERVEVELRQEAIFAVPQGAETKKALQKRQRKRRREENVKKAKDEQRAKQILRRMVEATMAKIREEERAWRAKENAKEARQLWEEERRLLVGADDESQD